MVVIREIKTFYFDFDLPKDVGKSLKHEIEFIKKSNESLAEKKRLDSYYPNLSMEMILMNTENSKRSESHKFVINLSRRLDLRISNKHVALQNLSTYCTWKNVRQQY